MTKFSRWVVPFVLAVVLGACAGTLRTLTNDEQQEVVGMFATQGVFAFVPCGAPAEDARWLVHFHGRAGQQIEQLRTAGLLDGARPLLVRVTGQVSRPLRPGSRSGGYTREISVIEILGLHPSGGCEAAASEFRRIS